MKSDSQIIKDAALKEKIKDFEQNNGTAPTPEQIEELESELTGLSNPTLWCRHE